MQPGWLADSRAVHTRVCLVVLVDGLRYKGAIFGACIVYILPALMYASLRGQEERKAFAERQRGAAAEHAKPKQPRDVFASVLDSSDEDDSPAAAPVVDGSGIELSTVQLDDSPKRTGHDFSGITGGLGQAPGTVVVTVPVGSHSAAADPAAARVQDISHRNSTRYLWHSVLQFCVLKPSTEGVMCAAVIVWGVVSGGLGVLVTAGVIHKQD